MLLGYEFPTLASIIQKLPLIWAQHLNVDPELSLALQSMAMKQAKSSQTQGMANPQERTAGCKELKPKASVPRLNEYFNFVGADFITSNC